MIKYLLLSLLISFTVIAADNVIVPKNSGTAFLKDNTDNLMPLSIAYTTDGAGHLKLINSNNPVDDSLIIPANSGKMFLDGADHKLYPASILYTTDGNGNVIPIPVPVPPSYTASLPLSIIGTNISIPKGTSLVDGYIDHTDWNTFNGKENAGVAAGLMSTHNSTYNHADISLNTAARHSHANKSTLDLISEAFTTSLKSTYDGYSTSKEPTITAGTTSQYWRGDKSWQSLNTDAVPEGTAMYFTETRARIANGNNTETDKYYVDGNLGDDALAIIYNGSSKFPFKTIQACLDYLGQPSSRIDALRHITINISGKSALSGALFSGIYTENLTVPSRFITMQCSGCKIDGNILKEYSSSRRFGASSSELRPTLTLIGVTEARDSHSRIRTGFHVGGTMRTSILHRNLDSIRGNGSNKVTIQLASGQYTYPIVVTANYPTEPYIRVAVINTTNYNATYDITSRIDATHFEATRVSGTNANVGIETSGDFFESDSAGASGITHDSSLINVYMQGAYTCDDGTVNGAAITAGTEVLYSDGSRFYTGIEGRTVLLQRWTNTTLAGAYIVSSIAGMNNCSFAGTITTSTFTYSTDDMGWTNNRFNSAVPITVSSAGQTVRMDNVSYTSFLASGSTWVTNTPTIAFLDSAKGEGYSPTTSADWTAPAPTTVQNALDRISHALATHLGTTIP